MLMKIEKGGNEKLSLKVVVYFLFFIFFYTCQMTSQMMISFQELFTNKPMREEMLWMNVIFIRYSCVFVIFLPR